ncbi:MAG TPA: RdgB/HAM1 family non-canonical purine NTP pyrophosphatase [Terriglobales bacterium]|nr:RdgB/HAM1 family non-canonical purine NTP pyrophosphatase [Terriglobales bacterium]
MLPEKVFIATSNAGKLRDFAGVTAGIDAIALELLPGFSALPSIEEDGETFEANACKKAGFYSGYAPGAIVLADDSGLEVVALDNAPGVRSARYAADDSEEFKTAYASFSHSIDEANNRRLLRELAKVLQEKRAGRFVCALAAARDGRILQTFEGEVRGTILYAPRGENGFGYDPLFYLPELGKTTAELTAIEKAKVSHRGQAFRKFLEWYKNQR